MFKYEFSFSKTTELHKNNLKNFAELLKKNQVDVQNNPYAQIFIGMIMARSEAFKETKEWEQALNACNGLNLSQSALEMGQNLEIAVYAMEILERCLIKLRTQDVELYKQIEKPMQEIQELFFSILKQQYDIARGIFDQLIRAGTPPYDRKAQEIILEDLKSFQSTIKFVTRNKYRVIVPTTSFKKEAKYSKVPKGDISSTRKREFENDFYLKVMDAVRKFIQSWDKIEGSGYTEWIKGVMRRGVIEDRKEYFKQKRKNIEFATDPQVLESDKLEKELRKLHPLKNVDELSEGGILWIDQVAEIIDVHPETLRNWDKKGIFPSQKLIKKGQEYRFYNEHDIPKLIEIKHQRQDKRGFRSDSHYSLGELAKYVGVNPRTIMRHEDDEKLPKAQRNELGHRIYTHAQAEKIKNIFKLS